jgi:hypothetical protein
MRENIVHITGWDEVTVKALRAYLDSGGHYLMPAKGFDAHNDNMIRARAEMSFEDVLQEWEEIRATLKTVLAELSDEDLKDMLYSIAEHAPEHAIEVNIQ